MNRILSTRLQKLENDAAGGRPALLIYGDRNALERETQALAEGRQVIWVRTGVPRAGEKGGGNE
ncbi:hypothetical protein MJC1_03071 [Methylocystis sp. MJC1]|jgi:hypothetical protein|nr:hypothetical protein MJC1_03071 [Methylocystis sp. MJC1]